MISVDKIMIKRNYFVAGEINCKNGTKTLFFRHFSRGSWLDQSVLALADIQKSIASDNGVEVEELAISAFNRC
jgi:hypothetical protein